MFTHRLPKKITKDAAAELCIQSDVLEVKNDRLTLEEKVTLYFEQWRDPVNRYVVAAFGDPAAAEDITQEAFLQLYGHLNAGRKVVNVRAWVFRAAHSLAISRIRSQRFIEVLDDESWEELRRSLSDSTPNPEQQLLQLEKFRRLRLAISRLTAVERQCLHLRTKGLRYREIAEVLELASSTVAETLYRVIDKLTQANNG